MKSFFSHFKMSLLISSSWVFCASAQADYDTLFLDLAAGSEMEHFRLGMGETQLGAEGDRVTSMVYLGYFQSNDLSTLEKIKQGEQKFEILTLGAGGFGYLQNPAENGGAEFDFELANTTNDELNYDRTGIGMRAQIFIPLVAGLQANVGVNLRPFFLSFDWDDTAKLEYEYQAGLEYAFNWDIAVYAHYRFVGAYLNNDDKLSMAEATMFGLRARF